MRKPKFKVGDTVRLKVETLPSYVQRWVKDTGLIHTVDSVHPHPEFYIYIIGNNVFAYNFQEHQLEPVVVDWKERYSQ